MNYNFKEAPDEFVEQFKEDYEWGFEGRKSITFENLDATDNLFLYGNKVCYTYCEDTIALANIYICNELLDSDEVLDFFDAISQDAYKLFKYSILKEEFHEKLVLTQKFAYIEKIEVHPQFRGIGVGTELLLSIENFLSSLGVKTVYLVSGTLSKEDEIPHNFYEKLGYKVVSTTQPEENGCRSLFKYLYTEPSLMNVFRAQPAQIYIEDYIFELTDEVIEALSTNAELSDYRFVLYKDKFLAIHGEVYEFDFKFEGFRGLLSALEYFKGLFIDLETEVYEWYDDVSIAESESRKMNKHLVNINNFILANQNKL